MNALQIWGRHYFGPGRSGLRSGGSLGVYFAPVSTASGPAGRFPRRLTLSLAMLSIAPRALATALLLCTIFVAGCDTSDPVEPADPADVAGVYDIAAFRFTPDAQAIDPANVLEKLDQEETYFELLDTQRGGQFQLRYRRTGELADIINGDFEVDANSVDMTVREEDQPSLTRLLLDPEISLVRESVDTLTREVVKTVNLEQYDPEEYGGAELTNVRGTLELRLVRRGR